MEIVDGIFGGGGVDGGGWHLGGRFGDRGHGGRNSGISPKLSLYTFLIFPWNAKLNNDITIGIIHALYRQTVIL